MTDTTVEAPATPRLKVKYNEQRPSDFVLLSQQSRPPNYRQKRVNSCFAFPGIHCWANKTNPNESVK